jgi:uncharacterized protein (DUF1330 family)
MAAYIIVQIEVTDPEIYATYRQQVPATLEPFGGEFVVRAGEMAVLEGDWPWPRCVVLRFPDLASAKAWHSSDVYAALKALRQTASQGNMIVVEGV